MISPEQKKCIRECIEAGYSYRETAHCAGCCVDTVERWCARLGLAYRYEEIMDEKRRRLGRLLDEGTHTRTEMAEELSVSFYLLTRLAYDLGRRLPMHADVMRRIIDGMVTEGCDDASIRDATGLSQSRVDEYKRELGLAPRRNQRLPSAHAFRLLKRLLDGERQRDLAREYGVTDQRINQIAAKAREAGFDV